MWFEAVPVYTSVSLVVCAQMPGFKFLAAVEMCLIQLLLLVKLLISESLRNTKKEDCEGKRLTFS